jgi:hypothetical protein
MKSAHPERAEKIKHELTEMLELFFYLAFFFGALAIYDILLLRQYDVNEYWSVGFALINAAVITKVIMIGEYVKLGKQYENKAILISAVWKAFVFGLLVFAFHVVEEVIKRLIHGTELSKSLTNLRLEQFAGRAIVVFCVFIPLFAWREFRRVMGKEEFRSLFYGSATANHSQT